MTSHPSDGQKSKSLKIHSVGEPTGKLCPQFRAGGTAKCHNPGTYGRKFRKLTLSLKNTHAFTL